MEDGSHGHGRSDAGVGGRWLPAAVIEHDAPGGLHFDLLLAVREPRGPDDRACATWRCDADPTALAPGGGCACEPIDDHRAAYVALEGPRTLSGGRGSVRPVAGGRWRAGAVGLAGVLGAGAADAPRPDAEFEVEWMDGHRPGRMTLRFAADGHELRRTER